MSNIQNSSRRRFIQGTAAGLVIGVHLPMLIGKGAIASPVTTSFDANAFIRIAKDNTVTVLIKHIEFGQGAFTGLATLVAEDLEADWSQMRAEHAPTDVTLYKNLAFGVQGTGGSTGLANSYLQMRRAGANAKRMLISAAAQKWQVDADSIEVSKGKVEHLPTGKQFTFGELVESASKLSLPTSEPALKPASEFTLIGTDVPKLDSEDKSKGQATYTLDLYQPNMLTAVVAHPPAFGATVASFDASQALKIDGVVDVKQIPSGVVVYAKNTHAAIKGRKALTVKWDEINAETRNSNTLHTLFSETVQKPGTSVVNKGDAASTLANASQTVEVELHFPYLAHAPMEPLDALMVYQGDSLTAWFGSQIPTMDQGAIAASVGLKPEKVTIHTQLAGGSFGRRSQPDAGFAVEAAMAAKAIGKGIPVKTMWTREDDIKGGRYRPMAVHRISAALDTSGNIKAWQHRIAVQSILKGTMFEGMMQNGIDPSSVEGVSDLQYEVANIDVSLHDMEVGVPVLWWRSVGHTHTAYAVETFIDMLLEKAERDPISGRIALLGDRPREKQVLELVAKMSADAGPVPKDRARGVAIVKSFGSYVAQIAEISQGDNNMPIVHQVWCAVDCGIAVNSNIVRAQIEGGMGYGLDAILHGEITLGDKGRIEQSNFHDYVTLRINEMPKMDIQIVKSDQAPSGVGEPGTPPIGPAVSNAWRRLTGQYVQTLPFSKGTQRT
ncbi:xanthine dehydrogenase family protein molybdopterin-binding subunit [Aliiglaciecola sp.]|nr:xanthine dehydrogenase family protein molybdopterin-binding subunit [Aliiglaciecola sp.]